MGGERRADAAPAQAKDPKRAENEGNSEQCHLRQRSAKLMLPMMGNTGQIGINAQAGAATSPPFVCDLFGVG